MRLITWFNNWWRWRWHYGYKVRYDANRKPYLSQKMVFGWDKPDAHIAFCPSCGSSWLLWTNASLYSSRGECFCGRHLLVYNDRLPPQGYIALKTYAPLEVVRFFLGDEIAFEMSVARVER